MHGPMYIKYTVSLLSCPRTGRLYRIESLHPPGHHPTTAAVLRDTIRNTPCAFAKFNGLPTLHDVGRVVGMATGYGLDSPGIESRWGVRFSAPVQTNPGAHPASCTMVTGSFGGVKSSRGVTLTPHPLLVPWSRKSRAIPLLALWAVWPVQSLSAYTRVQFT
jgi:hypothetical protein